MRATMTTVFGYFDLPGGAPYTGRVAFVSLSTPSIVGGKVVLTKKTVVETNSVGYAIKPLKPGRYRIEFETTLLDSFVIVVPDSPSSSVDVKDLAPLANPEMSTAPGDTDFIFRNGQMLGWNDDTMAYHRCYLSGVAGKVKLTVEQTPIT